MLLQPRLGDEKQKQKARVPLARPRAIDGGNVVFFVVGIFDFFVIECGSGWPLLIMIYIIIIIIMFLSIVYAAAGSNVKSVRSRLSLTERDVAEGNESPGADCKGRDHHVFFLF